jgi:hypothetical protein
MRFKETIEVKQNLSIVARERGKIIARRDGHNIWLDLGSEYLAELIALSAINPDVPERNDRIKYMGLGIGGTSQLQLSQANTPPISPPYSGTNAQTDTDPAVTVMERPVRILGSETAYPGVAGDEWIGEVQAPATHTIPTEVTFRRLFGQLDVSYGSFLSVPLSEVGLFTSAADPNNYKNLMVAYDTFDTISKTSAVELEVVWTIKF